MRDVEVLSFTSMGIAIGVSATLACSHFFRPPTSADINELSDQVKIAREREEALESRVDQLTDVVKQRNSYREDQETKIYEEIRQIQERMSR